MERRSKRTGAFFEPVSSVSSVVCLPSALCGSTTSATLQSQSSLAGFGERYDTNVAVTIIEESNLRFTGTFPQDLATRHCPVSAVEYEGIASCMFSSADCMGSTCQLILGDTLMKRGLMLVYGATCYLGFLAVFLYLAGFIGGFATPTRLDGRLDGSLVEGLVIDLLLVAAFGLQHSVMARPGFKRLWTRWVPPPAERSTYVLMTNLVLVLLFWQWRPLGGIMWDFPHPTVRAGVWGLFAMGWLTVLVTTFLINHIDLFGLRQVWLYFRGRPYSHPPFMTPGPYRFVRHPLYVGWLLAFWATPTMSFAHLAFATAMTVYIVVAIRFEERDLSAAHAGYAEYRRRVPMLVPSILSKSARPTPSKAEVQSAPSPPPTLIAENRT